MRGKNLILTGMPASGKSTLGVLLAKALQMKFIDTDLLLQKKLGMSLCAAIEQAGIAAFLEAEEQVLLELVCTNTVVATGGSAVFGEAGMRKLREGGTVVYLQAPYAQIAQRLVDITSRGVVLHAGETLEEAFARRTPLYETWADCTVHTGGKSVEQLVSEIAGLFTEYNL